MAWGENEAKLDTPDVTLAIDIAEKDGSIGADTLGEPLPEALREPEALALGLSLSHTTRDQRSIIKRYWSIFKVCPEGFYGVMGLDGL